MQTLSKFEALEIFKDNLPEIKQACEDNMDWKLKQVEKPDVAKSKTYDHFWVKANLYQLEREQIFDQYRPTIRVINIREQEPQEGQATQVDVERAKEYPITELLNVTRKGNISCPFHKDRNPSFQIKKNNTFTCHSCGEYGDSIDLYQKLNNKTFIESVKALSWTQFLQLETANHDTTQFVNAKYPSASKSYRMKAGRKSK